MCQVPRLSRGAVVHVWPAVLGPPPADYRTWFRARYHAAVPLISVSPSVLFAADSLYEGFIPHRLATIEVCTANDTDLDGLQCSIGR